MSEYIIGISAEVIERAKNGEKILITPKLTEIVRCRDCKYYEAVPEDSGDWCGYWTDRVYGTDGFCAWGKRKVDV